MALLPTLIFLLLFVPVVAMAEARREPSRDRLMMLNAAGAGGGGGGGDWGGGGSRDGGGGS